MACPPSIPMREAIRPRPNSASTSEADRASPKASGYFRKICRAMSICSSWTRAAPSATASHGM